MSKKDWSPEQLKWLEDFNKWGLPHPLVDNRPMPSNTIQEEYKENKEEVIQMYCRAHGSENSHYQKEWVIKEYCNKQNITFYYYRKVKNCCRPMWREWKVEGPRSKVMMMAHDLEDFIDNEWRAEEEAREQFFSSHREKMIERPPFKPWTQKEIEETIKLCECTEETLKAYHKRLVAGAEEALRLDAEHRSKKSKPKKRSR